MKRIALTLLPFLLLGTGCSEKKSTSPEEDDQYTLEASQTVGSEGGTISTADFSLIIPAGAFTSNATLKLYACSNDKPFGDRSATRTFKLEGIPDEYSQPMKLCMKYTGTISNQGYVAAGGMATHPGSDELKPTFTLFPAIDSSGHLCAELPAAEGQSFSFSGRFNKSGASTNGTSLMLFVGLQNYDPPKQTAHFKIYSNSSISGTWKFVLEGAVELAYDSLRTLGLNMDLVPWPINVYTMYLLGDDAGRHCVFSPVYETFNLIVDDRPMIMGDQEYLLTVRAAVMRELAHAILCTYDKEYFNVLLFHTVKMNPQRYWLHHAVASWCEEEFLKQRPLDFDYAQRGENPFAPFRGMQAGAKDDLKSSLKHGGGMYAVIEFLTLNYRVDAIWRIYELGIKNRMHPVEAILNSVADEANAWWPEFFKEYVNTETCDLDYGYFSSLNVVTDSCSINSKEDTYFALWGEYPDLSANTYMFLLNYEKIDTVRFRVQSSTVEPEDIMIMVFSSNDTVLFDTTANNLIAQGNEQVAVDVNQLLKDGYRDLMAVVVNSSYDSPYTGTSEIDLEVWVVPEPEFDYNEFNLAAWVTGHWYTSSGSEYDYKVNPLYCCRGYGECSGYTFTSAWDTAFYNGASKGSATIIVDPNLSKVISFSSSDTTWNDYGGGGVETTFVSLSGTNLPFDYSSPGYLDFRSSGATTCNYLSSLEYKVRSSLGDWAEVTSYWCDPESKLSIQLYKK